MTHDLLTHAPDALWYARAVLDEPGAYDAATRDTACAVIEALSDDDTERQTARQLRAEIEGGA